MCAEPGRDPSANNKKPLSLGVGRDELEGRQGPGGDSEVAGCIVREHGAVRVSPHWIGRKRPQ